MQAALSPAFDWLFIFFTLLGEDYFYIVLIGIVYWCFHKKGAVFFAYLILFSAYVNYFFKMLFNMDRPPPAYRIIDKTDISHGFPSGHAQSSTVFWTWSALRVRSKVLYFLSPFLIFMISLSRIYLGVHYPGDVIGGVMIGLVFTLVVFFTHPLIESFLGRFSSAFRQSIVPVVALLLFAVSLLIFPDTTRDDPATVCGGLFGFSLGVAFESKYVGFTTEKTGGKKRWRMLIGLVVIGVTYVGLAPILPSTNVFTRFARYAIITFAAAFIVPLMFNYVEKKKSRTSK
jgi:membrane-associated phospholipid phosphatase